MIKQQRYAHAKQFKCAKKQLRTLKTYLGRTIRDIRRKVKGNKSLEQGFLRPLWLGERVMTQQPRDDIPKRVYSLHAPEVECIGKGKAHKPYEFGVKAFNRHAAALQVQSVYQQSEASGDAANQARTQTAFSCGAGHRPPKVRPPHGPQLSRPPAR